MSIYTIVNTIAIFQSFLLALIFFLNSGRRRQIYVLLGMLFLMLGFNILHHEMVVSKAILNYPHFYGTGGTTLFLIGPTIYFLLLSLTNSKFKFRWIHMIHLIPFLIYQVYKIPHYNISAEAKLQLINVFFEGRNIQPFDIIDYLINFAIWDLHPFLYILGSFIVLGSAEYVSKNVMRWLKTILYGYTSMWFIVEVIFPVAQPYLQPGFYFILAAFLTSVHILFVTYLAQSDPLHLKSVNAYGRLSSEDLYVELNKLKELMLIEKLYKDNRLSLRQLSERLNKKQGLLSQVLKVSGTNFYDFVNEYRINEAKQLLIDKSYYKFTIEYIAQEVGFKSKDVFYRTFKNFEGTTPAKFKKSHSPNK